MDGSDVSRFAAGLLGLELYKWTFLMCRQIDSLIDGSFARMVRNDCIYMHFVFRNMERRWSTSRAVFVILGDSRSVVIFKFQETSLTWLLQIRIYRYMPEVKNMIDFTCLSSFPPNVSGMARGQQGANLAKSSLHGNKTYPLSHLCLST